MAVHQVVVVIITEETVDVLLDVATTTTEVIADAPLVVEITIVKDKLWL